MHGLLVLLLATALGQDSTQALSWDVTYQGKAIGTRTVTVKYVPEEHGTRRILESETALDGKAAGLPYTFRQRFTATASGRAPASFSSVVDDNGDGREVQGRMVGGTWLVTVVEQGRSKTWEVDGGAIHMSTIDLFDPESFVPIGKFASVKMLAAETGDIWEQPVQRLGLDEVVIGGQKIPVEAWAVDPPQGRSTFWYTTDGVLARYEYRWMGRIVRAQLSAPPPPGIDDGPVPGSGVQTIGEVDL